MWATISQVGILQSHIDVLQCYVSFKLNAHVMSHIDRCTYNHPHIFFKVLKYGNTITVVSKKEKCIRKPKERSFGSERYCMARKLAWYL